MDVFHCHNEPSWFVSMVKEVTQKPVILDIHDTFLTRSVEKTSGIVRETADERNNFSLADGLIFVTDEVKNVVVNHYGLSQPSLVLPSYVPREWYQYRGLEWMGGLVYEGKVTLKEENTKSNKVFSYCDYEKLAKKTAEIGMDFHLYTVRDDKEYINRYKGIALLHAPCGIKDLLAFITRHDWGLVGNIDYHEQWQKTASNKFFEYIAAGVPPVAINAEWHENFIKNTGIGISVKSIEELAERWSEHTEQRKRIIKERQFFAMDNYIHELEQFYRNFL